jgi:hypothetical protein
VRQRFQTITDRFATFQAQCLNVHVDFPLLQRIALPINVGSVRYPGIKIHDARIIRLLEVLLHNGSTVGGWTTRQIHEAVITTFQLSGKSYGLNQLRYDLRKLKGTGYYSAMAAATPTVSLPKASTSRSCSCSSTSASVARSPTAASITSPTARTNQTANSKLETAYYKADKVIENIVNLLQAA